jgi:hypothetical protein
MANPAGTKPDRQQRPDDPLTRLNRQARFQ